MWPLSRADMLAERHQQPVDLHPILPREFGFESDHGLLWRSRLHVTPPVRHAMNMHVDADVRLAAGNTQHQVSTLGANAFE
jgi:hypothetical protein